MCAMCRLAAEKQLTALNEPSLIRFHDLAPELAMSVLYCYIPGLFQSVIGSLRVLFVASSNLLPFFVMRF